MASVNLRNGESQDSLLKRFRKKVVKSGVLSTVRRKRWFVSKSEQRRMEKKKIKFVLRVWSLKLCPVHNSASSWITVT
ncbi:MAG TPA: 30S ribosomal protein S21 [Acidobacteriota bacterium]|nr:30S ribosomal protein S21 [Acidobacteriota bacterium]